MTLAHANIEARPRRGAWIWGFIAASPLNAIGFALVSVVLLVAAAGAIATLTGWQLTPYPPLSPDLAARLQPPSLIHLMGTDELGRDLFSRVVMGAPRSVQTAFLVLAFASVFGMTVGIVAGFFGGLVDEILMRMTDLFLAFPLLILAAAIATTFGGDLLTTTIALAAVFWPWYARIARSRIINLREQDFVLAARALGASRRYLMFRTLLPLVWPAILTQATLEAGFAMLAAAGLSFLGLGAQPPDPEWGTMILGSLAYQPVSWWMAAFPGAGLCLAAMGFNLLGDGLREYWDPSLAAS
jgi:peptide/nickel transport system permease protein